MGKGANQGVWSTPIQTPDADVMSGQKSLVSAYILGVPLGLFGAHHFYLGRAGFGLFYLLTLGVLGVGWVVDLVRMPWLVRRENKRIARRYQTGGPAIAVNKKHLDDAYLIWLVFGLFGGHHFYLGNVKWGVVYLFTFAGLGFGWVIDGLRMKWLVEEANTQPGHILPSSYTSGDVPQKSLAVAYILCFPLIGLLGAHHFYLNRPVFGVTYFFTLGLLGMGYVVDLLRMPCLVNDINMELISRTPKHEQKRLDDTYLMLVPLGLFGAHHFYLRRWGWGVLYLCTLGVFGFGFIVDLFRLPFLLKEYNQKHVSSHLLVEDAGTTGYGGHCGGGATCQVNPPVHGEDKSIPPEGFAGPETGARRPSAPPSEVDLCDVTLAPPSYDDVTRENVYPHLPVGGSYHNGGYPPQQGWSYPPQYPHHTQPVVHEKQ